MKGTFVVMPAFNEQRTVAGLIRSLLEQDVERVVVVDDGSTDATDHMLKGVDVDLVVHAQNLGKGSALSSGFRRALELGAKRVISIDTDGQHRREDVPRLEAMSRKYPEAIVIAARLRGRDKAPWLRRFANAFADFLVSWAGGQRIRDSQSGFRLYPHFCVRPCSIFGSVWASNGQS